MITKSEVTEKQTKVSLPFGEEGIVMKFVERPWSSKVYVKITKSSGFNELNKTFDFLDKQIDLLK
jgi:hypothetical protein